MSQESGECGDDEGGSPACLLHELGPDGVPADIQQARDVARWRKLERERLIATRMALPLPDRTRHTAAITRELDRLAEVTGATIVSVYWPIRAEPDLRGWMEDAHRRGLRMALPVALSLGQPMIFREWKPDAPMARGLWQIPYPAAGAEVQPTVVIAPLVGFDPLCYRLGYGGGFFDRTLAAFTSKPLVVGVGYPQLKIPTIFPQSHDVPMDWILAGTEPALNRPG